MSRLIRIFNVWLLLYLISLYVSSPDTTQVFANLVFQHSITSNGSAPGSFVESLDIAPQDVWNCLCKGTMLEFYIRRGIYEANNPSAPVQPPGAGNPNTPSAFQDITTSLAFYQIGISAAVSNQDTIRELDEVSVALNQLGVQDDQTYYAWNAWFTYKDPEQIQYHTLMSPNKRVIISTYSESAPRGLNLPTGMPSRWSDIVFLGWSFLCRQMTPPVDPGTLRYVIRQGISNPTTLGIMNEVAPNVGPWPGSSFDIGTREAQALLGTPNGFGVAWMLLQRQKAFANRKVTRVVVFKNLEVGKSLLFELDQEQNPTEPMAIDWEWALPDGDPMELDRRSNRSNEVVMREKED